MSATSPTSPSLTSTEQKTWKPGVWSYLLALLLPFVGIIIAIVAFAKGHVGPGIALLITMCFSWLAWFAIFAILGTTGS